MINLRIFLPISVAMLLVMVCGAVAVTTGWFSSQALVVIIIITGIGGGCVYNAIAKR